jgi:hypothetical protein
MRTLNHSLRAFTPSETHGRSLVLVTSLSWVCFAGFRTRKCTLCSDTLPREATFRMVNLRPHTRSLIAIGQQSHSPPVPLSPRPPLLPPWRHRPHKTTAICTPAHHLIQPATISEASQLIIISFGANDVVLNTVLYSTPEPMVSPVPLTWPGRWVGRCAQTPLVCGVGVRDAHSRPCRLLSRRGCTLRHSLRRVSSSSAHTERQQLARLVTLTSAWIAE